MPLPVCLSVCPSVCLSVCVCVDVCVIRAEALFCNLLACLFVRSPFQTSGLAKYLSAHRISELSSTAQWSARSELSAYFINFNYWTIDKEVSSLPFSRLLIRFYSLSCSRLSAQIAKCPTTMKFKKLAYFWGRQLWPGVGLPACDGVWTQARSCQANVEHCLINHASLSPHLPLFLSLAHTHTHADCVGSVLLALFFLIKIQLLTRAL